MGQTCSSSIEEIIFWLDAQNLLPPPPLSFMGGLWVHTCVQVHACVHFEVRGQSQLLYFEAKPLISQLG